MTAVIYARYSSDNQREESIEGQIRECTAYAEKNGITIVKHYIDRAISAKTDNRPEFQQMIKEMTEVYPPAGDVPRSFLFFGCLCRYYTVLVGADGVCIDGVALGGVGQDAEGVCTDDRNPDCRLFPAETGQEQPGCTYSESDHLGDWICGIPNSDEHRHAAGKHSAGYGDYDCNLPDRWKICFIKSE